MSIADDTNEAGSAAGKKLRQRMSFKAGDGQGAMSARIWRSRISWRIAFAVFLTIMTVQAGILALTLKGYQQQRLNELEDVARSSLAPLMDTRQSDVLLPPFDVEAERRLVSNTPITGLAIYTLDAQILRVGGDPVLLMLQNGKELPEPLYTQDGRNYEVVFRPRDLNSMPYYIVARLDAAPVSKEVAYYVQQNILIMFLLSAFVTTVLMIALGKWLLEPILFLRDNLNSASKSPEAPMIRRSPYSVKDEIGGAISVAQDLIKQNAKNLKQIKTAAQSQIHKLAYYDSLTALPNRTLFLQKLSEHAKNASASATIQPMAVVALDLDHFKDINDSMGHNVGDAILRGVGKRLRAALPEIAVVARTGEDEFAITYPLNDEMDDAKKVGEKIQKVIKSEPFKVFHETFQVRASIGVAKFPDDAIDPDQVLKNADIALNRAKEDGRDCIREYLEDFDKLVQARFQMLRDLRDTLERGELSLYYQPQLDLRTGKIIGAEALLRWFKPDSSKEGGKFISPAEFVPVAEQSGLIVPIGEWVLRKACETAKQWHNAGHPIRIAVNVSGAQFHQSDLVEYTGRVLKETGIDPHLLELEVTESSFMEDIQQTIKVLQQLHGLGVELAIDDFGTGYSSLSYLRQFPIDRLKIDQSFIRNALNNADDRAIARTIIGLGRSLNLKVIAEGVETKDHETFLIEEGCDEVQGFRYSRAVPDVKFAEFIHEYKGNLSHFDHTP